MLLCFISTTFWQCQKEELETIESTKQGKLNLWVVPGEKAFNESKQLRERVTSLKRKNTAARLTSTIYNFSIEEEHVQIIIGDDYTQYTFNVERDNPTPNLLENYVCKIYTDGEVFQYLMGYPYTIGQNGISYQMQNSTIQVISDENILVTTAGRGFPPGCVPEFLYEVLTYECTNYSCSGPGSSGEHQPGQGCLCGTPSHENCTPPYTNCSWITTAVYGGCGGGGSSGGDGGFTPPAGGGSGGSGTTTPVEPVVTVPFDDALSLNKECQKITTFLDSNPNFKLLLLDLNNYLSANHERSISKFETQETIIYDNGSANQPEVKLLSMPANKYEAFAHTQYEDPLTVNQDNYSVFSIDDLIGIASLLKEGSLSDEFVTFLPTGKGTYYALTIQNKNKFLDFFYYALQPTPPTNGDPYLMTKWLNSRDKYISLEEQYYSGVAAVIKADNSDNQQVLTAYLKFMDDANLGASMFKSDSTWN
ncbi:hypothetical protein, partial [Flavobacterium sp.]|uniref:hypothetical protein n=1 Tax=Flavobacterium sp. TaxID=239 RepID=UPI0037BE38BE